MDYHGSMLLYIQQFLIFGELSNELGIRLHKVVFIIYLTITYYRRFNLSYSGIT